MESRSYKKQAWKKKQNFSQQQKQHQPYQQQKSNFQNNQTKSNNTSYGKQKDYKQDQQQDNDDRCFFCRSKTHRIRDCIQAKKMRTQFQSRRQNRGAYYQANMTEETQDHPEPEGNEPGNESDNEGHPIGNVCLSENFLSENRLSRFRDEAKYCAALDTCCSQTVSGKQWFNAYKAKIPNELQKYVKGPFESHQYFRFGDNKMLKAEENGLYQPI